MNCVATQKPSHDVKSYNTQLNFSKQAENHLKKLAKEFNCKIVRCGHYYESEFFPQKTKWSTVRISEYRNPVDYFSALHEFGHACQCRHFDGIMSWGYYLLYERFSQSHILDVAILAKEFDAWDWALKNALILPNSKVKERIRSALRSYWRPHSPPKKDDKVWVKLFGVSN
jgi:hypothetical protein